MNAQSQIEDPRFLACIEFLPRTGAESFQLRYSDDEEPVVWFFVVLYDEGRWETASGRTPIEALFRVCDQIVDGGICTHCNRPTGFFQDMDQLPMDDTICWYQWDPELKTIRRGCE